MLTWNNASLPLPVLGFYAEADSCPREQGWRAPVKVRLLQSHAARHAHHSLTTDHLGLLQACHPGQCSLLGLPQDTWKGDRVDCFNAGPKPEASPEDGSSWNLRDLSTQPEAKQSKRVCAICERRKVDLQSQYQVFRTIQFRLFHPRKKPRTKKKDPSDEVKDICNSCNKKTSGQT